jgi:hypothetical protein
MTGEPFFKTRTITSERLISPLASKRDLNDAAIAFKSAVHESISRPTLNVGLSIKALESASGSETYKDTDGKKRTNSGGTPGMVELPNGYSYDPNQKWEDGKVLKLFPSIKSRKSAIKEPNFGWIDKQPSLTADEYAKELAKKPQLRIRKYKVNKKTDEIIPESEQLLDPFSLSGGTKSESTDYQVKRLPGRTIGQRGRSLLARAASAFGIMVDENGKFRCPPGTPAANQFTDSTGTNCFGVSASEILDFAKRMASGIDLDGDAKVKNSTKKLFEFVSWLDNGGIPGLGRTVWRDQDGNRIRDIKKWREVQKTENGRVFVDGMIRAQDKLAQQDIGIASLMDMLGVVRTDEKRKTNDDVFEVFEKLRESGAWTVDTSTRLSPEDVDKIVRARLTHVPGFSKLPPDRQKKLIEADTERWYTTERALLEASLDSFIADPEHMRTISKINFQVKNPNGKEMDEASTEGFTTPDTNRLMSIINVDIPEIMNNQEAMIPSLAPNERIKIDFIGGKTDSESAKALTDFLVTVDGHSKQLAAMVEERAFARHIMKHEIAHTIQFQAFSREAERQIRTNGFISVLNSKGETVRVDDIKKLNSDMVFSLMKQASDGIDLESLKNALSRADVVGFLAGDYPKMYFNEEYGAEVWALEATAELWALRDLGLVYGDDIDSALEWMDDISDGRYLDIRRRSDADGLRDIEARFYENRGPDPELSGNSIAEVKGRLEAEHKGRLSQIDKWSNDESTTSDDFVGSLAELEYRREALNAAYDNLEASGESKDSPQFKEINRKIKETNAYISLIEKKWAERFSSSDSDKRKKDMKSMRESVRQTMFAEGLLQPEEMAARARRQDIKNLKERADSMTADEAIQKLADIEISLKEPGISEGMKSELLEDKKIVRAIYKSRFGNPEDAKEWSKKRRELDTRIDEIVNPPRQQAIKKTKKVKSDSAAAKYAKKMQKENAVLMTADEIKAVERLGDPAQSDIANLLDPDSSVSAVKNINRKYRRAQRSAGDLSPESESATLEDKIERTLIPVMEAMDESSIPDDMEIEAEMFFDVKNGFKLIEENLDNPGLLTGRIISEESPHKPGEVRDGNGEILTRKGKEKSRVIVQVSKGDRGLFGTRETPLGEEGLLTIPPGKLRVVDTRPDGTIVVRVQEQDNVIDVLDRVSFSIGEEGPGASQNAKGTKKKIDRVSNKYVAKRRENGMPSTGSKPKREVEIEEKNTEIKREVIKAGGSFGEPPSEDYVAELVKTPLIQPDEADIKPDEVDPKTGRAMAKLKSNMTVDELVNRRAAVYRSLLDPDYANDPRGFQGQDRATLRSIDEELAKRGENISSLPKPADFDPDHKSGSKKKAPYKTSSGSSSDPTSGREVLGIPQTREQRKEVRTSRAQIAMGDLKKILAGESPTEVTNDMSRDSLDPAVANEIARKSPEALIKDIEDAASEFHAGVDKRPRVRMTESQLTKFANDGELLPTETDDIVLESGAIGRRLERRLNPATRRSSPGLSSGKRSDSPQTFPTAESNLAELQERSVKAKERVANLEKALDVLERTGEWRGEEFGVVITNHPDWKRDIGKFDADTPPVNITKEEIEKRFGSVEFLVNLAEEKLDRSKKEIVLAEHLAKTKEVRAQQNTLDIEDITPDDFQLLLDEYEQLAPEDYGSSVVHVGQSELDGGVLDPSKTTGGEELGAVGGVGNTGALNQNQISNLKRDNDRLKESLTSSESILKSFNEGEKTYTPKDALEAAFLNKLLDVDTTSLGAVGFKEGIAYDITRMSSAGALSKINSELESLKPQIKNNEQTLEAVQGAGKFGFVSAYPASEPVNTDGYFGRNAGSVIPKDIATYRTEVEAKLRQRPQYDDVKDREFLDRWMRTLRGSAYLVTDTSVISSDLGPRSLGEKQILGKVKPIFSVSAPKGGYNPLTSEDAKRNEWGKATNALMARAIRLEREGREVTPASVLGARRGKPLSDSNSSSVKLSSGARVSLKKRKIQLQKVSDAEKYLRNLDLQIAEVDLIDSETGKEIKSPIFSVAGRPMVLVDVNGIRIPFYQSTGKGGKENPTGKWYPIFGVGKSDLIFDREFKRFIDRGGWFNKGDTYESIDNYYDVPEFKRIATILNDIDDLTKINFYDVGVVASEGETLELLKKNGSTGYASSKLPKARMSVNDDLLKVINRDLTPYSTVGDAERSGGRRWDYINSVIDRIEKNRVKLDINSVSVAVDKDKLSVSKESNRIKSRDVQLTVKDKNGDAIKVSIESELETRFDDREVQNVTVRMRSNGTQVGVLYARTDIRGELGNQDKLTISDVLVPEDYHRRGHGRLMLSLAEKYNIGSEKINHSSKLSELGELFAGGTGSDSGRLSSGARSGTSRTQRVAGIAGGRATGRVLDAVLKRSGADEDTRERVKYGMNMAGALAAGGPAGFATALAVDVSRRAGREIAERGLEEAVQRGKITQQQMDVAMQAVNRVAPNGLPDPVVDKLADAWSVASDFIDERVATDENMQRLDEFGDVIRASGSEFVTNAGEVVDSAREKIGKRFRRGKNSKSATDSFSGSDDNTYEPAKTEFDDFSDPFSSGKRAGRSADAFRGEYNSRIGISKSTPNSAKPVSGYIVHRSHNEEKKRQIAASGKGNIGSDAIFEIGDTDVVGDGLTALGEIEVILKPEVSDRTSYGRGEALQSAHRPVSMNSSDADDIADALFNADGISSKEQNTEAMLHLLGAKMDKNFSSVGASRDENGKMSPVGMVDSGARGHEPFEAQILGGFKKNEVEGIHYPYSKVSKIAESEDISDVVSQNSMKSKLEKLGFTPEEIAYFYSMSGGKPINTASMTKLKEYRTAKKIKEQYEGMGIGYVKFAHPQGINIENPRSYDKTANQNARVDEILKKAIDAEIDAELKSTLDSIRKGQQLDLVVD